MDSRAVLNSRVTNALTHQGINPDC